MDSLSGKFRLDYFVFFADFDIRMRTRRRSFGGYFQWVLDAACEAVEWPYQPLGFDSLALRSALGPR